MKTAKLTLSMIMLFAILSINEALGQWNTIGNSIYNSNTGNVGIGNSAPASLLYVAKNTQEPTITVRNLGGVGGATYVMQDNASGATWKFKGTFAGGFKIRDHANLLDVITIEPNSFANAIYIKTGDNMGIGTSTPANAALVDMTSTSKGFLPPRMTSLQRDAIENPIDGLLIFNLTTGCLNYYFGEMWKSFCESDPELQCGLNLTVNHLAGAVAPVTKTVTYGTVTSVPGEPSKCWITSNLGADHQAIDLPTDTTEASAGWYWQFNRMQGYKHTGAVRTPNTTWITSINENSDWLTANDPCALLLGNGWRLPTLTEWTNVDVAGGWASYHGPWFSSLKMHKAGMLVYSDGSLSSRGGEGYYWSSSQNSNTHGWKLEFGLYCGMYEYRKAYGLSARCLRD